MICSSLRIALVSEHASPLATIGDVDAGGQNVYVAHLARELARAGHQVDVLTRRDDEALAAAVDMRPGVRVLHIDAGPARFVPKEQLLPHMGTFARSATRLFERSVPYDVVHSNFFMSGLVGLKLKERFGLPLVVTFHALDLVRREHQREADVFPALRIDIERRIVQQGNPALARALGRAGMRRVRSLFTWERVTGEIAVRGRAPAAGRDGGRPAPVRAGAARRERAGERHRRHRMSGAVTSGTWRHRMSSALANVTGGIA
jgi:glycosyltransferase involved in cell wall biosynthesis